MITCTFEDGGVGKLRHVTVDVILVNKEKNKILLVRRAKWLSEGGKLSLPGGYMSRDETIVETALRECKEESGYSANIVSLFRINDAPKRLHEDRQNVSFTFIAIADEKLQEHDNEVNEVQWIDFSTIPPGSDFAFDHFETIQLFLLHLTNKFALPIFGKNTLIVYE
jgi:oxygen-independent coproporphyrinogen III oxidase